MAPASNLQDSGSRCHRDPRRGRTGKITPRGADFYHAKSGSRPFGRLLTCKATRVQACGKKPHNGGSDLKRMPKT